MTTAPIFPTSIMATETPNTRIRLAKGRLAGEMLHQGRVYQFDCSISGQDIDAEFRTVGEEPFDRWEAFRALEAWIEANLCG